MHRPDEQKKLLDLATDILLSDDARKLAREAREAFTTGVQGVRWTPTASALQPLCAKFDAFVLPLVEKLQPTGRASERIRSHLGRMLFVRFLENAACSSTSLPKLARRYARDLLAYGSRTFRLRTVVPILAFESEREFSFAGTIGREQYRCRLVKLKGRMPQFFGYYVFPTPGDFSKQHVFRLLDDTEWAAVVDVLGPRSDDGDVGRGEPSAWHVPRALETALRLFADGEVHYIREFDTYDALHMSGFSILERQVGRGGVPLRLTSAMIREFRRWWKCLEPYIPFRDKLPPRIDLAVSYFNSSYGTTAEASFLDLHIALESLTDVHAEHTFRLPLRVSALLAATRNEAVNLADETKSYWETRCKIAHGDPTVRKPKFQGQMRAQRPQLRALVRRVIRAHLRLFEDSGRNINAYERSIRDFDNTRILTRGYRQ